jgi:hypothetical protein
VPPAVISYSVRVSELLSMIVIRPRRLVVVSIRPRTRSKALSLRMSTFA